MLYLDMCIYGLSPEIKCYYIIIIIFHICGRQFMFFSQNSLILFFFLDIGPIPVCPLCPVV